MALSVGGGLITLVALLGVGLLSSIAIGINKLQVFLLLFLHPLVSIEKIYSILIICRGIIPILVDVLWQLF
jgi:hypothetical protein